MPYAVDLTLFISREDVPTGRLPERHESQEAAEQAGQEAVARYAAKGFDATFEVGEVQLDDRCPSTSSD